VIIILYCVIRLKPRGLDYLSNTQILPSKLMLFESRTIFSMPNLLNSSLTVPKLPRISRCSITFFKLFPRPSLVGSVLLKVSCRASFSL